MSVLTAVRKMIIQTPNLMSSGGSSFEALTTGDVQGLLMSCDANPLVWSFFEAKYQITESHQFQHKLIPFLIKRITDKRKGMKRAYIEKNHVNVINAANDLSHGLAGYLARHKINKDKIGYYFDIEKSKFSRYYAPFIRECIADLERDLGKLELQIKERLRNE